MKTIIAKVRNNTERKQITTTDDKNVKEILKEAGIDFENALISLDGVPLSAAECGKALADLNIGDEVTLTAIVKTNNAAEC